MNIRKLFREIKEELDEVNSLRERILYPESPLDKYNNLKQEKEHRKK